ncbi:MAG: hypothetical protein JRJ41_12320 [Deltaproteobacteria bacterium]|nr:hypothetical protein [Deltaproteobacteria bacterium]MBW2249119.1 hypothetical protein [Deltaproteobacteria bacterium]
MKLTKTNKLFYIYLSLFFMLFFTACNASLFSYLGATVDMENRIALLEGKSHKGSWKTRDLSVNYNYKMDANVLQLSGQIEFDNQIHKFASLDHFSLWVYFLDEEGKVIGEKAIAVAGYRRMLKNISFDHNLQMPSNANGIAFGYDGTASDGGGSVRGNRGGETSWDFWKVPRR